MKANEFIKKFGWDKARYFLGTTVNVGLFCDPKLNLVIHQSIGELSEMTHSSFDFVFHRDDLKRLIKSHELVEEYNGLFEAKELIRVSPKMTSELRELAAAIADVESCQ